MPREKLREPDLPAPAPMRHYDVLVSYGDDDSDIVLVQAKSPVAALRTALNTIERDWRKSDIATVTNVYVKTAD